MKRPTVYLDTTIISSYWYDAADVLSIGRRIMTREWWETERQSFTLVASYATEDELAAGTFRRQEDCLRMCRRLPYLPLIRAVYDLAEQLVKARIVPTNKPGDALQIAVASVHEIDYLLTWNYAHLANPMVQARLLDVCDRLGLHVPWMVSPESIPRSSLGQTIRRPR